MTRNAFMQIFWGFPLIFLDFRINGIDCIPDFMGYISITAGLSTLSPLHSRFSRARLFAAILIFLSFVDFVELKQVISESSNITYWINPLFPLTTLATIVDLIMVWNICGGISELAAAAGNQDLARSAKSRRDLYVGLSVITLCGTGLVFVRPEFIFVVAVLIFIFAILVICLLMDLLKKASLEIGS